MKFNWAQKGMPTTFLKAAECRSGKVVAPPAAPVAQNAAESLVDRLRREAESRERDNAEWEKWNDRFQSLLN